MKTKKSIFSILLSLVLVFTTVFAVSTPVFAASKAEKKEAVTTKLKNDYKTIKGYGTEYKYKSIKVSYGKFASGSTVKRSSTITMKNSAYKITIKETATYNTSKKKATAKYAMKCTKGGKVVKESTVSKLSGVKSFLKKYKKSSSSANQGSEFEPYNDSREWDKAECKAIAKAQADEIIRYAVSKGIDEDDIGIRSMYTANVKGDCYKRACDYWVTVKGKTFTCSAAVVKKQYIGAHGMGIYQDHLSQGYVTYSDDKNMKLIHGMANIKKLIK